MTKKHKSNQAGGLNEGMIVLQQGMLSSRGANLSTLATLDLTAPPKQAFQATPNSLVNPHLTHVKIISAFAAKLGTLVEWRKVTLVDGREGYALFFDQKNWLVDPMTKELTPLG